MKKLLLALLALPCVNLFSQELFVLTEPASNMPAKSIGIRSMQSFMFQNKQSINYHQMPEFMVGINRLWMVHLQGFISNRENAQLVTEGASLYTKFRFFSNDDRHSHFRLAAFGRMSFNQADIHQDEIETMGHNTGYELGIVTTQLLHKWALNASVSYEQVSDNSATHPFPASQSNQAINYSLSVGKLVLPKHYTHYNQVNTNVMLELLGQSLWQTPKYFMDAAAFIQWVIKSRWRVDVGYRQQLTNNMIRTAPNGFILKLEYTFFNVW